MTFSGLWIFVNTSRIIIIGHYKLDHANMCPYKFEIKDSISVYVQA